jgi:hypothetical protein
MDAQQPILKLGTPIQVGTWRGTVERFDRSSVTVTIHPGRRITFDRRLVEDAIEERDANEPS